MTPVHYATALTLGVGLFAVLAVGFFTGFGNTWPIVVLAIAGAGLLNVKRT